MARRIILNPKYVNDIGLKGVIFDMDGTLCLPQTWMFGEMRSAIDLTDPGTDILDFIAAMSPDQQKVANAAIAEVEHKAMKQMEPHPGLLELMLFLDKKQLKKGICTRNLIVPVNHLLENHLTGVDFDAIVTREFQPPKPSGAPLQHIAQIWGLEPKNLIMVGDSMDDMLAGARAGCATILLKTHANKAIRESPVVDYVVDSLDQIIDLIEKGFITRSDQPLY